jgi:hypothetical protein
MNSQTSDEANSRFFLCALLGVDDIVRSDEDTLRGFWFCRTQFKFDALRTSPEVAGVAMKVRDQKDSRVMSLARID